MRKIVKITCILLRSILLFIAIGAITTATVKNVESYALVQSFIKKGVYQESISTDKYKYYKIQSTDTPSMTYIPQTGDCYPGQAGDILCSLEQNTMAPVANEIITFFAGGHAGFCTSDYSDYNLASNNLVIEATMMQGSNTKTRLYTKRDWMTDQYFSSVIGLRVDLTDQEKKEVESLLFSYIDDPYNSSFLFDTTNKSYCTDILSKAYRYVNKDLNKDNFTTSVYDLVVSSDTYISYYHYYDSQGVKHIYYFG